MESIYWVVSKDCNQRCPHCYNFSAPGAPGLTVEKARRVIAHFPERHGYRENGSWRPGRFILSGGEVLIDRVREPLLYPCLSSLRSRYGETVRLWIQTNGDVMNEAILDELAGLGVSRIDVSGIDAFHENVEGKTGRLSSLFEAKGWKPAGDALDFAGGNVYCFWGATPETWIGKIWPAGRALATGLSKAGVADNFCDDWSGARGFLNAGSPGSEVNVQLEKVYPCCRHTRRPIGDLLVEPLEKILNRHRGDPVFEALNRGRPEEMGISLGISKEKAMRRAVELGNNLCYFCDDFLHRVYDRGLEKPSNPRESPSPLRATSPE